MPWPRSLRKIAMKEGRYYYAITERLCILKLVGCITLKLSADADAFLTGIFSRGAIDDILIDLTETQYIDSTNLGILARLNKKEWKRGDKRYTIVSTNQSVNEILFNLNFDRIFEIVTEASALDHPLQPLPPDADQNRDVAAVLLKAHRYLMSMNDANRAKFYEVVEFLKEDMRKKGRRKVSG
jgi:anti-anti-sigma factor